jgi:hypothetical protein
MEDLNNSKDLKVIAKGIHEMLANETPSSFQIWLEENGFENDFEEEKELSEKDLFQIGFRGMGKYIQFFNEFIDLPLDENFRKTISGNDKMRAIMVRMIEVKIIEKGV